LADLPVETLHCTTLYLHGYGALVVWIDSSQEPGSGGVFVLIKGYLLLGMLCLLCTLF